MWGSYTDTSAWRGVNDYQRAFERWQKAPQWRNDTKSDFEPRKIEVNSSKRKWSIRLLEGTGAIACRYWKTDVVTFNPDNSITLHPWRSISTDVFANALTPSGIGVNFNAAQGMLVSCGEDGYRWQHGRIYELRGQEITFEKYLDGSWWPRDPEKVTDPIDVPRVNRKRARAAMLKHDLKRFEQWARTATMMRLGQQVEWTFDRGRQCEGDMVDALDDREQWIELIKLRRFWPDDTARRHCYGRPVWGEEPLTPVEQAERFVKRLVSALRLAVYTVEKAVDVETVPYYESWQQVRDIAQKKHKFYHAMQYARRGW